MKNKSRQTITEDILVESILSMLEGMTRSREAARTILLRCVQYLDRGGDFKMDMWK